MKIVILVPLLVVINLVYSQSLISNDLIVQTDSGRVKGSVKSIVNNASSIIFLGIPYAKPPIGSFRFRRPLPPSSWSGVLPATTMPKICYPSVMDTSRMVNSYSEDCLYINIYVPANRSSNAALPVFVWVHSDSSSSTMMELSNGNALAVTGNFIVITFDFRQGALGYLTGIDSSGRSIFTPNLGILDQVMALKWVQRNIANFGGDPKRVTLAGATTGAFSVGLLFTNSTQQQSLYQRIALVSGSPLMPRMYYSSLNATSASMHQFLQESQCSVRTTLLSIQSCLRNLSIAKVLSAQSALTTSTYNSPFKAVIDGNIIKSDPLTALNNNQFDRQIQILASVVRPDSGLNAGNGASRPQFNQQLNSLFSYTNLIAKSAVVNRYTDWSNISSTLSNQQQLTNLYSDYFATAPLVNALNMISARGASTFMYEFSYPINMSIDFSSQPKYLPIRSEISYLFGYPILQPFSNSRYSSNDFHISQSLIQFWSNYVYNGNPASNNRLAWPKYSSTSKDYVKFTLAPQAYTSPRANHVAFWNDFFPLLTATQPNNCSQSTSPILPTPKTCAHPAYIAGTYVQFGILCAITISIVIYCIVRYQRRPSRNLTQLTTTNTKEEDENL